MSTIARVAAAMQTVLTTVADEAARKSGFVIRRSKLTGALFAQTLVFGWLANPDATLEELAQTASWRGLNITPQGLDQRFGPQAAAMMQQVLEAAVRAVGGDDPVNVPVLRRFAGVYVLDSTTISLPGVLAEVWPGCGGSTPLSGRAAVKAQVMLDLATGSLEGPELQAGRAQDKACRLQQALLPRCALRITDLGYFSLTRFAEIGEAGVYWLSRLHVQTVVRDEQGERLDLESLLAGHRAGVISMSVRAGSLGQTHCRLVGERVPEDVAALRKSRMQTEARREGYEVSNIRLALAGWSLMLTNAPPDLLSLPEAQALYRARWQIEMLFKLWKSHGKIDQSRSRKPWRVLCEVYAKLLAMLIQHWVLVSGCWRYPDRSLTKASATIRRSAMMIAVNLGSSRQLRKTLHGLKRLLAQGCRINRRRQSPATFQILHHLPQNAIEGIAMA
jgi:hypothetical protein